MSPAEPDVATTSGPISCQLRDTRNVCTTKQLMLLLCCLAVSCTSSFGQESAPLGDKQWAEAVRQGTAQRPDARVLVLDVKSGRVIAARHMGEASRTLSEPGSTLKPLILYQALSSHEWNASTRVECDRNLRVATHTLRCSHPPAAPFDARDALAWSCNSYFAAMARTLPPERLQRMLRGTGLLDATGLTPEEAIGRFAVPGTMDETQLRVLGVEGIQVTPLELATAYRWLAQELERHAGEGAAQTVRGGMSDSVSFGTLKGGFRPLRIPRNGFGAP
jgi:hypothetical protein